MIRVSVTLLFLMASVFADSDANTFSLFNEPSYPRGIKSSLLSELAEFFDPNLEEPKTEEEWGEMKKKLENAKMPKLAQAGDLRFSRKKILNLKLEPFLFVLKHESGSESLYRVHYIKRKGKLNVSDIGYGTGAEPVYSPSL